MSELELENLKQQIKQVQAELVEQLMSKKGYSRFAARYEVLQGKYTTPKYDELWRKFEALRGPIGYIDDRSNAEVQADTMARLAADQAREDHYE